MTAEDRSTALEQSLLRRALAASSPADAASKVHVRFRAEVVERYRSMPGFELKRTRTVGRVSLPNRWSLDMGIVDGEAAPATGAEVHVTLEDLRQRLPDDERPHWIEHLVPQPLSANFLQMKMSAAACIDDGDTVAWA